MTIRNGLMRIVRNDPADEAYDASERKAWSRDVEIPNWIVADEFNRVVICDDGKVLNGSTRIERLPSDTPVATQAPTPAPTPAPVSEFANSESPVVDQKPAEMTDKPDSVQPVSYDDLPLMQAQHLQGYTAPMDPSDDAGTDSQGV